VRYLHRKSTPIVLNAMATQPIATPTWHTDQKIKVTEMMFASFGEVNGLGTGVSLFPLSRLIIMEERKWKY
jgi:hypothetical protein